MIHAPGLRRGLPPECLASREWHPNKTGLSSKKEVGMVLARP